MGFLDRLFGGRAKTAEETRFPGEKMVVKAPMDGIVLPLEQLPDETFAAAILGPGCGIEPTGGTVYAPFDGKITSIVPTLHAMGLESAEGIELLIHIGMDTIALRGSGFTPLVREGQAVKAGTPLLNVDLDAIRAAGLSTESAVIVINADKLVLSAEKAGKKMYYRHTGYPGGIYETTFRDMQAKHPGRALEIAVKGMLPKGPLGYAMIKKLKIYAGAEHPHTAQQPKVLDL